MRSLGLAGDSEGFDGKLVRVQVICRTNIQTAPRVFMGYLPELLESCGNPGSPGAAKTPQYCP